MFFLFVYPSLNFFKPSYIPNPSSLNHLPTREPVLDSSLETGPKPVLFSLCMLLFLFVFLFLLFIILSFSFSFYFVPNRSRDEEWAELKFEI